MKKILASDKVYIKQSKMPRAGRGVYARRDIQKNEVIETCPIIEIPQHDVSNVRESFLVTYFYFFGKKKQRFTVALGFGSIYNHSYDPDAKYILNPAEKTIDFIALKDIRKDDEITVNYKNGSPKSKNPLWFEVPIASK